MQPPSTAPYGSWASPISPRRLVGALRLHDPWADESGIYWAEGRPSEGGRTAIVRRSWGGACTDVLPAPMNARTRVHEYGGRSYLVCGTSVYFTQFTDQRIYVLSEGTEPRPLTAPGPLRFAELTPDATRHRLIAVCEDHTDEQDVKNTLAAVSLSDGSIGILAEGEDFYASPVLSPGGEKLAWLSWNHPNMPWDGTRLWLASLTPSGDLVGVRCIAGGDGESIFQPEWGPGSELTFVSDRTGWWNLYLYRDGAVDALWPKGAEFGVPLWALGSSTYTWLDEDTLLCAFSQEGTWHLAKLNVRQKTRRAVNLPFTSFSGLRRSPGGAVMIAAAPTAPPSLVAFNAAEETFQVMRQAFPKEAAQGCISRPEPLTFATADGEAAHAFFYRPANDAFTAPPGERPPLLVVAHGGPTGSASCALNLGIQYWTSRGWAVADVDYRGSTGYGRAYRERLKGAWGVADVEDCAGVAAHLARQGAVDGGRVAIRGASAGGFTTLAALVFSDTFKAGASYFGVSDCSALARDTHKFESRYLDGLIGPWPQAEATYRERSPLAHAEQLSCPVIFFQGLEDKVVPPNQAEAMVEALRRQGIAVAYLTFAGEAHGFRKEETIIQAQQAELYFYARIFGMELAESVPEIPIDNLPPSPGA